MVEVVWNFDRDTIARSELTDFCLMSIESHRMNGDGRTDTLFAKSPGAEPQRTRSCPGQIRVLGVRILFISEPSSASQSADPRNDEKKREKCKCTNLLVYLFLVLTMVGLLNLISMNLSQSKPMISGALRPNVVGGYRPPEVTVARRCPS